MEQNNNVNEIDVRKLVRVILEHWWWFAIGVMVFLCLGGMYFLRKSPTWTTDAAIMLRQNESNGLDQIEALSMLGLSGNTAAEDEVVVLHSRGLLYQAIDALNLWENTYVKDGLKWKGEFKNHAVNVDYIDLNKKAKTSAFIITIKPTKNGYKIKTKNGFFRRSSTKVADLSSPIETGIGTIMIHANRELSQDTTYRVLHRRKDEVVANYRKAINVAQHKKESNIIQLSTTSPMPERDKALLYQIIEQYNMNAIVDKNTLATNTASFIEERLAIITAELSAAEDVVADYMEKNKIANIDEQAKLFLQASSTEQ